MKGNVNAGIKLAIRTDADGCFVRMFIATNEEDSKIEVMSIATRALDTVDGLYEKWQAMGQEIAKQFLIDLGIPGAEGVMFSTMKPPSNN